MPPAENYFAPRPAANSSVHAIETLIDDYSNLAHESGQAQATQRLHDEIIAQMATDFNNAASTKPAVVHSTYKFTNGAIAEITAFEGDSSSNTLTFAQDGQASTRSGAEALTDLQLILHSPKLKLEDQITQSHLADGTTISTYIKPGSSPMAPGDQVTELDFGDGVTEVQANINGKHFDTATVQHSGKFEQFQPVTPADLRPTLFKEI